MKRFNHRRKFKIPIDDIVDAFRKIARKLTLARDVPSASAIFREIGMYKDCGKDADMKHVGYRAYNRLVEEVGTSKTRPAYPTGGGVRLATDRAPGFSPMAEIKSHKGIMHIGPDMVNDAPDLFMLPLRGSLYIFSARTCREHDLAIFRATDIKTNRRRKFMAYIIKISKVIHIETIGGKRHLVYDLVCVGVVVGMFRSYE